MPLSPVDNSSSPVQNSDFLKACVSAGTSAAATPCHLTLFPREVLPPSLFVPPGKPPLNVADRKSIDVLEACGNMNLATTKTSADMRPQVTKPCH